MQDSREDRERRARDLEEEMLRREREREQKKKELDERLAAERK